MKPRYQPFFFNLIKNVYPAYTMRHLYAYLHPRYVLVIFFKGKNPSYQYGVNS